MNYVCTAYVRDRAEARSCSDAPCRFAHSEMAIKCKLDTYGYYLLAILSKIILVGGSVKPWHTEAGILIAGLLDFLLNPEIIYQ